MDRLNGLVSLLDLLQIGDVVPRLLGKRGQQDALALAFRDRLEREVDVLVVLVECVDDVLDGGALEPPAAPFRALLALAAVLDLPLSFLLLVAAVLVLVLFLGEQLFGNGKWRLRRER